MRVLWQALIRRTINKGKRKKSAHWYKHGLARPSEQLMKTRFSFNPIVLKSKDQLMNVVKNAFHNYPLLIFWSVVFLISWGVLILFIGVHEFPITEGKAVAAGMAILLGPSIAGLIFIALTYGLRDPGFRLTKWRVGTVWYTIALFTAPAATLISLAVLSCFSAEFNPMHFISNFNSNALVMAMSAGITVGILEELGWTGFAVPKMRARYSLLRTGIGIGLLWGVWHFPLFWQEETFHSAFGFSLLLARLFSWLPAYRVLMVWVYEHNESLFVTIIMHASLVTTLIIFDPPVQGPALLNFILARAFVLWVFVAFITVLKKGGVKTG